jgi:PEP-CTERM motif
MRKRAVLFMLAVLLLIPGIASAISIGSINAGTGFYDFGDKRFSGFRIAGATINPDVVFLDWTVDANNNYEMTFSSSEFFATNTAKDFTLEYNVSVLGSMKIAAIDQFFIFGASGSGGNISISENVFNGVPGGGGTLVAYSSLNWLYNDTADPPVELAGDQLGINPALSQVWVIKDIRLSPNSDGQVSATTIRQSFHQVPEPGTMGLLGLGMIGIWLFRRRKA